MGDVHEDDYVFLPVAEAVEPAGGTYFQHYVDAWWVVHPEKGLAFFNPKSARTGRRRHGRWGSPQCNTNKRISEMVGRETAGSLWPEVRVEKIPSAWVPIDISDYRA
jgi:hypothetical protein